MRLIVTALLLTLPFCIPLHHTKALQRQDSNTQACLFTLARLQHISAANSKPCQATPRASWGGLLRTIRHSLLWTVTACFSTPLSSHTDFRPLLLAVSNLGPAVQFIHAASMISVKCSAYFSCCCKLRLKGFVTKPVRTFAGSFCCSGRYFPQASYRDEICDE